MSSPLTAKRRKLNEATRSLSKPFVSPLRNAQTAPTSTQSKRNDHERPAYLPSTLAHTINSTSQVGGPKKEIAPVQNRVHSSLVHPARWRPSPRNSVELAVQRENSSLELQIRTVRNDIDALTQAERLNTSSTDADLEHLAYKWKLATQSAAQELFGTVKERVCRMGGVQAWKESERRKSERLVDWQQGSAAGNEDDDADCEYDENGNELPEDEAAWRKTEKAKLRKEMREAMEEDGTGLDEAVEVMRPAWHEGGDDDDASVLKYWPCRASADIWQTFTIDMMLRSLNIDLDKIGWDRQGQRWM